MYNADQFRTIPIWILNLHKMDLIGNLGGNFLYKREPPLCLEGVQFRLLPEFLSWAEVLLAQINAFYFLLQCKIIF